MNKKMKIIWSALFFLIVRSASAQYVAQSHDLNQMGALKLAEQANLEAKKLDKNISVAILNGSGVTMLLLKGDQVGPHNTEASRRKAYTALSTKTPSFELMQKAAADSTAKNLNTLPELLLLGGGVPLWKDGALVGSLGVSGAGGGQGDHNVAKKAAENVGFSIVKK
ncbi:MAG: heme-binding protein [Sphingobacteriaceae bacterium]